MQITGRITRVLEVQTGQSANGNTWYKTPFTIETEGQYPKTVCISVWGEKADNMPIRLGNLVTCDIDAQSREHNGRWYTELQCYKMVAQQGSESAQSAAVNIQSPVADDLPF